MIESCFVRDGIHTQRLANGDLGPGYTQPLYVSSRRLAIAERLRVYDILSDFSLKTSDWGSGRVTFQSRWQLESVDFLCKIRYFIYV